MLEFDKFYRAVGLLKTAQLSTPPFKGLANFDLPKWSNIHYVDYTAGVMGMPADHPLLRTLPRNRVVVANFPRPDTEKFIGNYIKVAIRPNEFITKYLKQSPKFKRADLQPGEVKKVENVEVYNYGLIEPSTTYQHSNLQTYYMYYNFFSSVINAIAAAHNGPKPKSGVDHQRLRNHFILIDVPSVLPSVKNLQDLEKHPEDPSKINILGTNERLFIGEVWKWLGDRTSIFSILTDDAMKKTNFMLQYRGSAVVVNLYVLKKFAKAKQIAKSKPDLIIVGQEVNKLEIINAQKRFISMLITFMTKVNAGIVDETMTEDELDGLVDEDEIEEPLVPEAEEDHTPTAKDIANQFIADTADAALDLQSKIDNKQRTKDLKSGVLKTKANKKKEEAALPAEVVPSDDVEDIFSVVLDDEEALDRQLQALEELEPNKSEGTADAKLTEALKAFDYKQHEAISRDYESAFMRKVNEKANKGSFTAAEIRRFEALSKKFKTLPDPYGSGKTLLEAFTIDPLDLEIPESVKLTDKIPGVFDESYLESTHDKMQRQYIQKVMKADLLRAVVHLQLAGYAINSYEVKRTEDVVDGYETHIINIVPVEGKPSTIRFRVPIVDSNGTFKAGGNINRMRAQRRDIPIRKIGPNEVAMTSYHSKMFVRRSELAVFDYDRWLEKNITGIATDPENQTITGISYGDCFDMTLKAPRAYSAMSKYFSKVSTKDYEFLFDERRAKDFYGEEVHAEGEKFRKKQVLVGKGKNSLLWMDYEGRIYEAGITNGSSNKLIGTIETIFGLDESKAPMDSAELDIFRKKIPLGIVIAYNIGLGNMLKTINAKYRREPKGSRLTLQPHEFTVRFQDQTLIFDRREKVTALLMSGWNRYHNALRDYSVYDFDSQDQFGLFLRNVKIEERYEKELNVIIDLWIDPITEEELIRLKEPTDMIQLYLSACEKLTYDEHPDPMDSLYQRDAGYERFSGFVYEQLMRTVRGHKARRFLNDAQLDMNPEEVWYGILSDETTGIAEFSNPIHSQKEKEVVVFRGRGGRSGRSMTAAARKMTASSIGRDSEATVDSGDVATVIYTTANPNYESVRGTARITEDPNANYSRVFGTSQLLAAGAEYDDPNRRNFISIQNSRTTNCVGSSPLPVRTGYERVLPYRVDDIYATVARQDGVVKKLNKKAIVVEYADGTTQAIEIGLRYGEWSGKTMPHDILTNLKEGDKFKKDTPITWNKNFFQIDSLTGGLIYKGGVLALIVLVEDEDTWEDSSAIHASLAAKLETQRVDKRDIVLDSKQEVRNLVKVGDTVDAETILCTIYSPSEGTKGQFTQDSLETFKDLAANNPKAQAHGVVTDIDVYYTSQPEDMSETVQDIVESANVRLYKLNKDLGKPGTDGQVNLNQRFSGTVMDQETVLLRAKILTSEVMDAGSKIVICHQMKSVVSRKIVDTLVTESGEQIGAKFSQTSFSNRIVESGNLVGSTSTLMVHVTKGMCAKFRGK